MTATHTLQRRAGAREWAGLAVLAVPCLLVSMDAHVLNLAIPALSADLRPTNAQLLWIVDSYAFLVAGCLMTMGALGDRVGRRRLLLIGAAGFGAASLLAAFATSPAHADRGAGPAGRHGSHADAVDARPDPRHVHRPAPAHDRVRRLDGELRARRRARSRGRGHPPAPLLVGLRLPLRRAADRRAAGAGARAAARAPGSRRRAHRQRRRRAVPGRRAQRGLRAQASGPGRPRSGRRHRARDRAAASWRRSCAASTGRPTRGSTSRCSGAATSRCRSGRTRCASSSSTARSSSPRSTSSWCSGSRRSRPVSGRSPRRWDTWPAPCSPRWRRIACGPRGR